MKGVGKTSLFEVFQGKPCPEEYVPSQEINTTHVFWTNPTTKDRVKVRWFGWESLFLQIEIWDVMDKSSEGKKDQVSVEKITGEWLLFSQISRNGKEGWCSEWKLCFWLH